MESLEETEAFQAVYNKGMFFFRFEIGYYSNINRLEATVFLCALTALYFDFRFCC